MSIETSVYSSSTASVLMRRMKDSGYSDLKSAAFMFSGGKHEEVINLIGNELGINDKPTDKNLSFDRYVTSSNDSGNLLFQGNDGNLYGLNFSTGDTSEQSEEKWIEENYAGLINPEDKSDRNYDVIDFGQNSAEIINYAFTGTGDGLDEFQTNAFDAFASNTNAEQWGDSIKWLYKEVDITAPSQEFVKNVGKNQTKYITSSEANYIYTTQGYKAYTNALLNKAISIMNYNDESGELTANELVEYYKQKLAEAEAAAQAEIEAAAQTTVQEQAEIEAQTTNENQGIIA